MLALPDVRATQNTHTLRVGCHDSILNSVMYHLNEMSRAVRSAMQIPFLRGTADFLTTRGTGNIAWPRRQGREYRIEMFDHVWLAPDHHAIAAIQAPDPPTGSHVDIMDLF